MIIQCTACDKKFSVPDAAITANGRLVQCSSCGNKWTQYPVTQKKTAVKEIKTSPKIVGKKNTKKISKKSSPAPYSKEYMQQKWGTSLQSYTTKKGISQKTKNTTQKKQPIRKDEKIGFGFFNYIITLFVLSTFFVGILGFERTRLSRKFPFLEPYIDYFFETLENFKIFILDFY